MVAVTFRSAVGKQFKWLNWNNSDGEGGVLNWPYREKGTPYAPQHQMDERDMFQVESQLHSFDTQDYDSLLITCLYIGVGGLVLRFCPLSTADGVFRNIRYLVGNRGQRSHISVCLGNGTFCAGKCPASLSCGPAPAASLIYGEALTLFTCLHIYDTLLGALKM